MALDFKKKEAKEKFLSKSVRIYYLILKSWKYVPIASKTVNKAFCSTFSTLFFLLGLFWNQKICVRIENRAYKFCSVEKTVSEIYKLIWEIILLLNSPSRAFEYCEFLSAFLPRIIVYVHIFWMRRRRERLQLCAAYFS